MTLIDNIDKLRAQMAKCLADPTCELAVELDQACALFKKLEAAGVADAYLDPQFIQATAHLKELLKEPAKNSPTLESPPRP